MHLVSLLVLGLGMVHSLRKLIMGGGGGEILLYITKLLVMIFGSEWANFITFLSLVFY